MEHTGHFEIVQCWCGLPVMVAPGLKREHEEKGKELFCVLGHGFIPRSITITKQLEAKILELNNMKRGCLKPITDLILNTGKWKC